MSLRRLAALTFKVLASGMVARPSRAASLARMSRPEEPKVTRRVSKQALDWLIREAHRAPTDQYSIRLEKARREMPFWSRRAELEMPQSMAEWAARRLEDSSYNWED